MNVRPAKTQISLGFRPFWSESLLSAWRKLGSLATHWAHSEDSNQTGQMPTLIWVFAGRTVILLVLSWSGSYMDNLLAAVWEQKEGIGIDFYHKRLKFWDRANSRSNLIRVYTVCHSVNIIYTHVCMLKLHSQNLRIIKVAISCDPILNFFMVMHIWAMSWDYGTFCSP